MDPESMALIKRLNARLLVAEAAIDAIFSVASMQSELQQALSTRFGSAVAATQEAFARAGDPVGRQMLIDSQQRFAQTLHPPGAGGTS